MLRNLHIDTTELDKLKGISIGTTDDDRPFLILTYKKKNVAERAFPWIFCAVVVTLLCIYALAIWWIAGQWM
jgi:hypothetical protein